MPDIGFFELLLIGTVAFLILGPERTPEFFAQIGRFMRQGRTWISNVKEQIDEETKVLQEPIQSARDALDEGLSSSNSISSEHDSDRK